MEAYKIHCKKWFLYRFHWIDYSISDNSNNNNNIRIIRWFCCFFPQFRFRFEWFERHANRSDAIKCNAMQLWLTVSRRTANSEKLTWLPENRMWKYFSFDRHTANQPTNQPTTISECDIVCLSFTFFFSFCGNALSSDAFLVWDSEVNCNLPNDHV